MTRRSFLAALGGVGVGGAALGRLPVGDVSSTTEVSIAYGTVRTDPGDPSTLETRTKTVPAEWYEELRRTTDAHRRLARLDIAGFLGSFVVPGDHSDPSASISVHGTTESVLDEIADRFPDTDVEIEVFDELPPHADRSVEPRPNTVADLDAREVPGGVLCGNGEIYGSLAPALYDPSTGERFFATANHLYGGSRTDHRGAPLYLIDESDRTTIGHVRRGYANEDVVVIEPVRGYVPRSAIDDTVPGTVAGQFTKLGLADLAARGERLETVGAISGHQTGEIKGIDGVTLYAGNVPKTGQLLWGDESTITDGDSGSVNYHPDPADPGRVLIGGLNNARTWWPGADFTWGTAAYHVRDIHGFAF